MIISATRVTRDRTTVIADSDLSTNTTDVIDCLEAYRKHTGILEHKALWRTFMRSLEASSLSVTATCFCDTTPTLPSCASQPCYLAALLLLLGLGGQLHPRQNHLLA